VLDEAANFDGESGIVTEGRGWSDTCTGPGALAGCCRSGRRRVAVTRDVLVTHFGLRPGLAGVYSLLQARQFIAFFDPAKVRCAIRCMLLGLCSLGAVNDDAC
jgi:hypothetical protein